MIKYTRSLVIFAALASSLITAASFAEAGGGDRTYAAAPLVCSPAEFPAIRIEGDEVSKYRNGKPAAFRGFADPCIRKDPAGDIFWLVYSWPHASHMGGGPFDYTVGVETHLAKSTDLGETWKFVKTLWPKTPASYVDHFTGKARDGFISHEVPNMAPCVIDGKRAWAAARGDYFLGRKGNYSDRDNRSFCLRVTAAATPEGLSDSPVATLGHDFSSKECGVDLNLCTLSKDFDSIFIPIEPALYFDGGRLYMAFVCLAFKGRTPVPARSFIAVVSTVPSGPANTWKWNYHGKLATAKEAAELGGEGLTQIELAKTADGKLMALMTPYSWNASGLKKKGDDAFWGFTMLECVAIDVASLDKPALARLDNGKLAIRAHITASGGPSIGIGAAAYDPDCVNGVIITMRDIVYGKYMSWSIHPTRLHH